MSDKSDAESTDSVEEIITVRQLPVPRLKQLREDPVFIRTALDRDSGRGSERTKDSSRDGSSAAPFPPIIRLNVGGHLYMTRLSTLLKYSDSMLAAMFSGRHQVDQDKDGNYFLDSNGHIFGQILEFLRNGSLPEKKDTLMVYRDANYYGLHELVDKLSLRPEIAAYTVREAQKAQFPNYAEVRELVIRTAIVNASVNRVGEVNIYAFRKEFVPKAHNFNTLHACIADQAHVIVGPWESAADEENFVRCLETDLVEDGYNVKPHEAKRKCRYYNGQTCQKFIFRVTIIFD
ncbi:BTB/POZ domain-containing protein KCTD7-like [Babylonia areolata]|uniref:BTB/POZ domain-containing protein KCTD7-like n=1 Tax=Babylonia areolata TaxID=304850 RepID=UPI003FD5E18E